MHDVMELVKLIEVLVTGRITGSTAREITCISQDSRKVSEGCLFVAVQGAQTDGHLFISQASRNGAAAVVYQKGCLASEQ